MQGEPAHHGWLNRKNNMSFNDEIATLTHDHIYLGWVWLDPAMGIVGARSLSRAGRGR